jgi:alpha-L-rhamnosidase
MSLAKRVLVDRDPYLWTGIDIPWEERSVWPASWISGKTCQSPFVCAFFLPFDLSQSETMRVHVTADERYELFLDGMRVGRGPERGDRHNWAFETYDLALQEGHHTLVARVWALGELAPIAQFSLRPGFLLCPQEERFLDLLATGRAPWRTRVLEGYSFIPPLGQFGTGHKIKLDGRVFPWGFEQGDGEDWLPVVKLHPGFSAAGRNEITPWEHLLVPAALPAMIDQTAYVGKPRHISAPCLTETHSQPLRPEDHLPEEMPGWEALLSGKDKLVLPPNTRRRVIVDLEDYYCAYPELTVSGGEGGTIRLHWAESLFDSTESWDKGRRGAVDNKFFAAHWWNKDGTGDTFLLDGGQQRRYEPLWWHAGRYVEILVEADNHPLTIEKIAFRETRYPLEMQAAFTASDERLKSVIPIMVRGLQMCAHETYMDCPYYEQLMYVGDTRLECLVTYLISPDDRLPRKALQLFDQSRIASGLTQSRYPSRLRQIIPPFSLWWVAMINDYLMWRGDPDFVHSLLPGMRAVLDAFTNLRTDDRLVRSPRGWNYVDWVPEWEGGVPPGGEYGAICGPINWQYVYALTCAAQVETTCGETAMAERYLRLATETFQALDTTYWSPERGLYADDDQHNIFTEHSQCLALLSGMLSDERKDSIAQNLFSAQDMTPPTVYFMHYFFEACRLLERMDVFMERMSFWFEMVDYDFKTTYENGNPHTVRSDCHAWGAHPLYHYFASILGVRPASPSFTTVEIRPQLGHLESASGTMQHPAGEVQVSFWRVGKGLQAQISLPEGTSGRLIYSGHVLDLVSGQQEFALE